MRVISVVFAYIGNPKLTAMATLGQLSPERPSDKDYAIIWYLQILIQHGGQCNMYTMHGKNNPPNSNDIIWAQDYLRGQGYIRHLPNQIGVTYQIIEPTGRHFLHKKVFEKVMDSLVEEKWFTQVSPILSKYNIDDQNGALSKAITKKIKEKYNTKTIEEDDSICLTEDAKEKYLASKYDFDESGEANKAPMFSGVFAPNNQGYVAYSSGDESPITQSVTTTPNKKNSAPKTNWYNKPLFTHFIWPLIVGLILIAITIFLAMRYGLKA